MNKKAEEYLMKKGLIAIDVLITKKHYEEEIVTNIKYRNRAADEFIKGLHTGLIMGYKNVARHCKGTLERMLIEANEKEKWKQRYEELNRYVELNYKDYM